MKSQDVVKVFDNLQHYVGKTVICQAILRGQLRTECAILKQVTAFDSICIRYRNRRLPFIAPNCVIYCIKDEQNQILYENPDALEYGSLTEEKVESARREMFGDAVVDAEIERGVLSTIKEKNIQKCAELQYNAQCYQLMKAGLFFVKPELIEEWLAYVNVYAFDSDRLDIVSACVSCLQALNINMAKKEIEQICQQHGLSNQVGKAILAMAVHFSNNGEMYQQFWKNPWGMQEERIPLSDSLVKKARLHVSSNHFHI